MKSLDERLGEMAEDIQVLTEVSYKLETRVLVLAETVLELASFCGVTIDGTSTQSH